MKSFMKFGGVAMLAASLLVFTSSSVTAGRIGGPTIVNGSVAVSGSVYYDIPFAAGERAVVTIDGARDSMIQVFMYDADGHVVTGTGLADRKVVTLQMDVYRSGRFRVEIRNMGTRDGTFRLTTN